MTLCCAALNAPGKAAVAGSRSPDHLPRPRGGTPVAVSLLSERAARQHHARHPGNAGKAQEPLVRRNADPLGAPGVRDMLRLSDARMSGTKAAA